MAVERIWVVPNNDGEAVEIQSLLREHGERFLISGQPWGASWSNLEPGIRNELEAFRGQHANGVIYGVELAGNNRFSAVDIDHHAYRDADRSQALSSLEQVAAILAAPLSRWRQLVAANDRGYIPAMIELGASAEEIAAVRAHDRTAQGITPQQETRAESDLLHAEWIGKRVHMWCPEGVTAAHSDRLYGQAEESLLESPQESVYYGPRHRYWASLKWPEDIYSGGSATSGYFGLVAPSAASRERLHDLLSEPSAVADGFRASRGHPPATAGGTDNASLTGYFANGS
jgi:hypothetical protein